MTEIIKKELTPEEEAERKAYEAGAYEREIEAVKNQRLYAYQTESDPIFFEWQRGENTEQAWKDKLAEIQARYPDPEK